MDTSIQNDKVRENTDQKVNEKIDCLTERNVIYYSKKSKEEIAQRINALEHEWDIDQVLELNAASLAFTGTLMALLKSKRWLLLTAASAFFLGQHAIQGKNPVTTLLRKMGFRTRREIDRELYALRALRGDFNGLPEHSEAEEEAVKRINDILSRY